MIVSFKDADSEATFHGKSARRIPSDVRSRARRKLDMINAAVVIEDLRVSPGNHVEAFHGDRKGQHSIRINDQWRICFRFEAASAFEVEIVDYH